MQMRLGHVFLIYYLIFRWVVTSVKSSIWVVVLLPIPAPQCALIIGLPVSLNSLPAKNGHRSVVLKG